MTRDVRVEEAAGGENARLIFFQLNLTFSDHGFKRCRGWGWREAAAEHCFGLHKYYPQEKAKAIIDFFLSDSFVGISVCRVLIQLLCSYSTLPLYAIVTQVPKYLITH
jgi:hypothetical protein